MQPLATVRKALVRAQGLPPERLLSAALRRGVALARERASDLQDRLSRGSLAWAVPGARDDADALRRLEATAGALPLPSEEVDRALAELARAFPASADALTLRARAACEGRWEILGYGELPLGVAPDWQRDFRTGARWSEKRRSRDLPVVRGDGSDVKIPWEISRLQQLPALGLAFRLTGERRFAELVVSQLVDWIEKNPVGRGVNWMCPMDVALRAISISWAFELCRRALPIPEETRARVFLSLFRHARFVWGRLEDGGVVVGNHCVADLVGVLWIATLYPALRGAEGLREGAKARLVRQLRWQIRRDGGDYESSLSYHRLVMELIGLATQLLAQNGRPSVSLQSDFARMAALTAAVTRPDGTVPQIGDNDGGRAFRLLPRAPNDQRYLPPWAALVTGDAQLAAAAPLDPEALLLCGAGSIERHRALAVRGVAPPRRRGALFPDSGLAVVREGEFQLVCAATPVGQDGAGGHGHNDKLSFDLFLGEPLVVDPGSFVYTADPLARNRFRGTLAHATLALNGLEQNPLSGTDLFFLPERAHARTIRFDETEHGFLWEAEQRGYAPLVHRRRLEVDLDRRALAIEDEVFGPSLGEQHATLSFPLAPGVTARADGAVATLSRRGAPVARLSFEGEGEGAFTVEVGQYSETYGQRTSCEIVRLSRRGRLPLRLRTRVVAL